MKKFILAILICSSILCFADSERFFRDLDKTEEELEKVNENLVLILNKLDFFLKSQDILNEKVNKMYELIEPYKVEWFDSSGTKEE